MGDGQTADVAVGGTTTLKAVANDVFRANRLTLALIGSGLDAEDFKKNVERL